MTDSDNKKKAEGLTRKEVAARFGVSVSTVRSWQRNFGDWLEVEEQVYSGGRKKATTYSNKDLLVFTVVQRLTGPPDHLPYKKVKKRLDKELTTATLEVPKEELPPEDAGEPGMAMVIWTQHAAVMADLEGVQGELKGVQGELKAVKDERDWLREHHDKLDKERTDLQLQLDEERQKSWWQKLRGR